MLIYFDYHLMIKRVECARVCGFAFEMEFAFVLLFTVMLSLISSFVRHHISSTNFPFLSFFHQCSTHPIQNNEQSIGLKILSLWRHRDTLITYNHHLIPLEIDFITLLILFINIVKHFALKMSKLTWTRKYIMKILACSDMHRCNFVLLCNLSNSHQTRHSELIIRVSCIVT